MWVEEVGMRQKEGVSTDGRAGHPWGVAIIG